MSLRLININYRQSNLNIIFKSFKILISAHNLSVELNILNTLKCYIRTRKSISRNHFSLKKTTCL